MDTVRRLLAALLIAMLSLFATACNGEGDDGGDEAELQDGGEEEGDD